MNLHPVLRWILWPLSIIYAEIAQIRVWCYRHGLRRTKQLEQTVISVGNLTVGGTGKTPLVTWLASRFLAVGRRVAILSRGHRPHSDLPGNQRYSDEVLLFLSRFEEKVPIGVGRDRYAAALGVRARQKTTEIDCFILDDGFQHLKLQRNVDIVLIDATNPFGGGFLLPAGSLRERPSALARADVIVIMRSDHSPAIEAIIRRHSAAPIFYAQTKLQAVIEMGRPFPGVRGVDPSQHRYLVFCGIGNPQAYRDDLSRWGIQCLGSTFFKDHHRYIQPEVNQLENLAGAMGATALLCTEKDVFNLDRVTFQSLPVHFCRIDLEFPEENKFWETVRNLCPPLADK